MQLDSLKEEIREITKIAETVPPEFRQKCFELLLLHLLGGGQPVAAASIAPLPIAISGAQLGYTGAPPFTALLTAFLKKHGLTSEQFLRVVGYVGGKLVFLREPAAAKTAQAQIDWTLLLALKNAIVKGGFSVDGDEVRLVCQEKARL